MAELANVTVVHPINPGFNFEIDKKLHRDTELSANTQYGYNMFLSLLNFGINCSDEINLR
jgi:hypothetical protein